MGHDEGMRTRREVLGAEYVDRAVEGTDDFTAGSRAAWSR
jgi:hypothetical protein